PFLQTDDKPTDIRAAALEIKHDISDPLPGAVIGQLPAAAALKYWKTWIEYVGKVRACARRVERGMFQQPNEFIRPSGGDFSCSRVHESDGVIVRDGGIAHAPFDWRRAGRCRKPDYQSVSRVNHSFTIPW